MGLILINQKLRIRSAVGNLITTNAIEKKALVVDEILVGFTEGYHRDFSVAITINIK